MPLAPKAAALAALCLAFLPTAPYAAAAADEARVVLPTNVLPEHYDLDITPDAAQLTFEGKVDILVRVRQPTTTIELNASDLTFDNVMLSGRNESPKVV